MKSDPFIHIDFQQDGTAGGLLFDGDSADIITCSEPSDIHACLRRVEDAVGAGAYAAGFISYNAASAFDAALVVNNSGRRMPLLYMMVSENARKAEPPDVIIGDSSMDSAFRLDSWKPDLSRDAYGTSFNAIQSHICDGDCYQINYTFPMRSQFNGSLNAFYSQLRSAQSARYAAWIHTEEWDVISASPELFFHTVGGRITTRPMKGTRPRGLTYDDDQTIKRSLTDSEKDRAENVMIVDLLRNDLGRIAETGSVTVDSLFDIEQYPTVWQMTSTVSADLKKDIGMSEIADALFPCGSVTGAPKVKTMEIISELESFSREVYCGSIGVMTPDIRTFNVAIRTVTVHSDGEAVYPVGSGLVADSVVEHEYDECLVKSNVLNHPYPSDFGLFETFKYTPSDGYHLLNEHLHRLEKSARYFDFPFCADAARTLLLDESTDWSKPMRVRLVLERPDELSVEAAPFDPDLIMSKTVCFADTPMHSRNPFLYHKTSNRGMYQAAFKNRGEADDVIFYNEKGELTESSRANLAVRRDGAWVTPPVSCGLLSGTERELKLERGELVEGIIQKDELMVGDEIMLFSSVRHSWIVTLVECKENHE